MTNQTSAYAKGRSPGGLDDASGDDLRESAERLQDFARAASDWFWEMDEQLRFSYFSERFTQVAVGRGIPGGDLDGLAVLLDRPVIFFPAKEEVPQVLVGQDGPGIDLDRLAIGGDGFLGTSHQFEEATQCLL